MAVLGALALGASGAAFPDVRLQLRGETTSTERVVVRIESLRDGSVRTLELESSSVTPDFEVDSAGAVATVEAKGLFAEPLLLRPAPAGGDDQVVLVDIVPGARVEGRILGPDGKVPAAPPRLRIESEEKAGREAIATEVNCVVDPEGRFSCPIPAERTVDLRLRVRGFASLHFWSRRAQKGQGLSFGELRLVPGGSVVGSVVSELPGKSDARLEVRLTPLASTRGAVAPSDPRVSQLTEARTPDARGNFSFEGLSPGIYTVRASQPGAVDAEVAGVRVLSGAETEIRDPLRLRAPISLTVFVDPPYFRQLEDWNVALWRARGAGFAPVAGGNAAAEAGVFVSNGLAAGTYRVDISPPVGGLFASQVVEIEPPSTTLTVAIDAVDVEGRVRLGDEPLWCRVTFERTGGGAAVSVDTNEEGEFQMVLPAEGAWAVRVESVDPDVQRVVEQVEVARLDGAGKAFVDIHLPGTRLTGRTVDESGAPIEGATVLLSASPFVRHPEQTASGEGGRFELEGVEVGRYKLSAERRTATGERESGVLAVDVTETAAESEVEIVLRKKLRLHGRIVGPGGLGVPAALVGATAAGYDFGEPSAYEEAETDAAGEFELDLPARTRSAEIQIQAPGYSLRLFDVAIEPGRELLFTVSPLGGGLEIEFTRDPAWLDWRARRPYLISGTGAKLFAGTLVKWAELNGVQNATSQTRLVVPLLEPGAYRICWLGPPGSSGSESCTPANVEPLGWSRVRTP